MTMVNERGVEDFGMNDVDARAQRKDEEDNAPTSLSFSTLVLLPR